MKIIAKVFVFKFGELNNTFIGDAEDQMLAAKKKKLQSGEDEILYRFSLEPEEEHIFKVIMKKIFATRRRDLEVDGIGLEHKKLLFCIMNNGLNNKYTLGQHPYTN